MRKNYEVTNEGHKDQAVIVAGWPKVVGAGASITIDEFELTDKLKKHYEVRGVLFKEIEKAAAGKANAKKAAAEKLAADISAAENAVLAAMADVDKAGDDMVVKAEAEKVLKNAEAALAALKG